MLGHHWHTSKTPFKWCFAGADDGLLIVVFGSYLPLSTKQNNNKKAPKFHPLWQNFLDRRMNFEPTNNLYLDLSIGPEKEILLA